MKLVPVILMLVAIIASNYYVFYRLWSMVPVGNLLRPLLVALGIILVASFFAGLFAGRILPVSVVSVVYKLGTSWFFISLYLLMTFLLLDLLRLTHLLPLDKYMFGSWIGLGVVTGFITLLMTFGYVKYRNKEKVELSIAVDKKMETNKPLKIVAISDLHLGYSIGKKEFERWIELLNRENPDIVLIAGDVIDNNVKPLYEQDMASSFSKIESKYGIYAAIGNHEYIGNISQTLGFLHQAGVNVLRDSVALINNEFYVVGRDDRMNANRKSIEELTRDLDRSKPIIMLDHQPYELDKVEKNNIDLQISGHTHHGQVWPASWITNAIYEKSHGYLKKGNSHIYVSSGLGIWGGKFRIGTQSEYVVIELKTGK